MLEAQNRPLLYIFGHSHGIGKSGIFWVLAQLIVTQGVTHSYNRSFFNIFLHKMSQFRENDRLFHYMSLYFFAINCTSRDF